MKPMDIYKLVRLFAWDKGILLCTWNDLLGAYLRYEDYAAKNN